MKHDTFRRFAFVAYRLNFRDDFGIYYSGWDRTLIISFRGKYSSIHTDKAAIIASKRFALYSFKSAFEDFITVSTKDLEVRIQIEIESPIPFEYQVIWVDIVCAFEELEDLVGLFEWKVQTVQKIFEE